jgi:acyl carrier protein
MNHQGSTSLPCPNSFNFGLSGRDRAVFTKIGFRRPREGVFGVGMADIAGAVLDIIAEKAKTDRSQLSLETELSTLTLDSLDVVEIIFQLEERFDISIPYNANEAAGAAGAGLKTVGDVLEMVRKQMADGAA